MIREDKFILSHAPYAVDLASFTPRGEHSEAVIGAVWFRRKRPGHTGPLVTSSCVGYIPECQISPPPADAADFLARMKDGRYGGSCIARWNGTSLWAEPGLTEAERAVYFKLLAPMLEDYPACPPGFDGWYTFKGA